MLMSHLTAIESVIFVDLATVRRDTHIRNRPSSAGARAERIPAKGSRRFVQNMRLEGDELLMVVAKQDCPLIVRDADGRFQTEYRHAARAVQLLVTGRYWGKGNHRRVSFIQPIAEDTKAVVFDSLRQIRSEISSALSLGKDHRKSRTRKEGVIHQRSFGRAASGPVSVWIPKESESVKKVCYDHTSN